MASLQENIAQAISDFDNIKAAIIGNGVEVPYGTDTKEYGELINQACKLQYNEGKALADNQIAELENMIDVSGVLS